MQFKYIFSLIVVLSLGYWGYSSICFGCDDVLTEEHHEGDDDDDNVESYEIYPGDVATKIDNGDDIILLDVRTLEEHTELHLENSFLLPVQELSQASLTEIGLGERVKSKVGGVQRPRPSI